MRSGGGLTAQQGLVQCRGDVEAEVDAGPVSQQ